MLKRNVSLHQNGCLICGKPKSARAKYCSDACRQVGLRDRRNMWTRVYEIKQDIVRIARVASPDEKTAAMVAIIEKIKEVMG